MPGLERIAWTEIRAHVAEASSDGFKVMPGRNGLALFQAEDLVSQLSRIRTAEDVFAVVLRLADIPWGREGLSIIEQAVARGDVVRQVERLADEFALIKQRRDRLTYRLIVRLAGPEQPYRRSDLAHVVERALRRATRGRWQAVPEGEMVELWLNHFGYDALLGLRLTGSKMRHRDYQQQHLPATLRPSVAATMAWMSQPTADDVFLDPMCGAGTILIERALSGWHRLLLGGDIAAEAVAAAAENIGPRHKPRQLFHWDARTLPLASGSVTKVATNLPFGVQMSTPAELPGLYRQVIGELGRVLASGGIAVTLSSRGGLLRQFAQETGHFYSSTIVPVDVLGRSAQITVLHRT
ncbi:MAG: RNA methyltransferase [Anaerolineales bacterium]